MNAAIRFERVGVQLKPEVEVFPVILDRKTNLMWDRRESPEMNFASAETYIKTLNSTRFGGFDDWRLPDHDELRSLIDLTKFEPATDRDAFPLCKGGWYWSSTPYAVSPSDFAWVVYFYDGLSSGCNRYGKAFVRACRPSQ
jgi:hypothetical protein